MVVFQGGVSTHPLTPDPSPPFHGGEGRISGQLSCRRLVSREVAKSRSREGEGGGPGAAQSGAAVIGLGDGDFVALHKRKTRTGLQAWGGFRF